MKIKSILTICMISIIFHNQALSTAQDHIFKKFPNNYFVETGCYIGGGIKQALEAGFEQIYSIELSPYYYNLCKTAFIENSNIKLFLGDSGNILYEVIKDIDSPITFWLDGHFSGGSTALGSEACPILKELDQIKKHPIKTHTILIDDLRVFGTHSFNFITIDQIKEKILEINPNYTFWYENGVIPNDVLVAQVIQD